MFKNWFTSPDWSDWLSKIRWQLISFKFLAFWIFVLLFILACLGLGFLYFKTIAIVTVLYQSGFITKESFATIIIHIQSVLFETALANILLFMGTIMTSIIAIKGISYVTYTKRAVEAIKSPTPTENLKQFIQTGS